MGRGGDGQRRRWAEEVAAGVEVARAKVAEVTGITTSPLH